MHTDLFDRYLARQSAIHLLDPRTKVVTATLFILSNVLLPDGAWLAFLLSFVALLLGNWLAGLGFGYTLKRSFVALPFVLAAITSIFALPGQAIGALDLGPWRLVATDAGLVRFASIVIRSWLSVQIAILLTATTQFPDLAHALRHLHVPAILVAIISFMYRYLFVLTDEALRLMRAREARSAHLTETRHKPPLTWRAKMTGNMVGQLFLRSYERSERVYAAMLARGYNGQLLTLNPHHLDFRDWAFVSLAGFVMLIFQIIARW